LTHSGATDSRLGRADVAWTGAESWNGSRRWSSRSAPARIQRVAHLFRRHSHARRGTPREPHNATRGVLLITDLRARLRHGRGRPAETTADVEAGQRGERRRARRTALLSGGQTVSRVRKVAHDPIRVPWPRDDVGPVTGPPTEARGVNVTPGCHVHQPGLGIEGIGRVVPFRPRTEPAQSTRAAPPSNAGGPFVTCASTRAARPRRAPRLPGQVTPHRAVEPTYGARNTAWAAADPVRCASHVI
jgi:hypothetical protein